MKTYEELVEQIWKNKKDEGITVGDIQRAYDELLANEPWTEEQLRNALVTQRALHFFRERRIYQLEGGSE
jgi:hypothetical protein